MPDRDLTIREMCDEYDVTARTLRFYEQKELLAPRREGAKRFYTKRDRVRLTLILRGKKFGFSLEDIRQLLALYDIGDQQETQIRRTYLMATERLSELEQQRDALDLTISELKDQLEWGASLIASFEARKRVAG